MWVDLTEPSESEAAVLDQLGLPELVLEDMRDDRHLPKLERVEDALSLTVHGLDVRRLEEELRTVELDCAVRSDLLVTYHDGGADLGRRRRRRASTTAGSASTVRSCCCTASWTS